MSAESSGNDKPAAGGPARPAGSGWPDPIRATRSIGPLSSFASLGPRLRSRRPLIIAGSTVVGLLGGAGAALATTGSGAPVAAPSVAAATPAQAPTPPPALPHRMLGPGFHRFFAGVWPGGGPAGLFGALHGQIVLAKPGGGYQTVDFQNGRVTAVSATSITLKSADGYTRSYAITGSTAVDAQRDGIGSVKVGNQVSVSATVAGSAATAVTVTDLTLLQQGRQAFGFQERPRAHGFQERARASWPG
jgi:hypothetical protein